MEHNKTTKCRHNKIITFSEEGGGPGRMWACTECHIRFYPACPKCVTVGHRNEFHPTEDWKPGYIES